MAKRFRRRYRKKIARWSPNIVKISSKNVAQIGEFFNYETLATNSIQVSTGVSQAYTVKNFEITFTIESAPSHLNVDGNANTELESITAYIMFRPQGMEMTSTYYADHPEYILAYKYLGSPSFSNTENETQQYQPYRIKTRLSRKLQTGDSVILYIQGSNQNDELPQYYYIDGIVRWWSKAN